MRTKIKHKAEATGAHGCQAFSKHEGKGAQGSIMKTRDTCFLKCDASFFLNVKIVFLNLILGCFETLYCFFCP